MDHEKIGNYIRRLRKEKGLTQLALSEKLGVSDKAVSKWERGLGCPDPSLLIGLSAILGVSVEDLLSGDPAARNPSGGNMRKLKFYVCPVCANVLMGLEEAAVSCCGKKLSPLVPKKAAEGERMQVERIDNEFFISTPHPMTKAHYISFAALLSGDALILKKLYPEWDCQFRMPPIPYAVLLWYCTEHGLFQQLIGKV